jgi:7-cyano-7-deazaguanine synthase
MKTVLSFSGGMDSTVLLYHLKYRLGHDVLCLSVNYGQRHRKELQAAAHIAELNGCEHKIADLTAIRELFAGSSQTSTDIPVPEGHYAEESMKQTVVPNRNMVLLSLATAWAVSSKSEFVAYAAHTGDHAIYPDCRPAFAEAMEDAISLCDWHKVKLIRPFLYPTPMDKTAIAKLGQELGVPLSLTWSCYKGNDFHCGKCGTCTERRESFKLAGIHDPTTYE